MAPPRRASWLSSLLGASPSPCGSCSIALFPEFADMKCLTMTFSPFEMRYRFIRSPPLPWLMSQGCPLQYFIDDRFSARMRPLDAKILTGYPLPRSLTVIVFALSWAASSANLCPLGESSLPASQLRAVHVIVLQCPDHAANVLHELPLTPDESFFVCSLAL